MRALRWMLAAAMLAMAVPAAQAGRNCEATQQPQARNVQRAMDLAEHTARVLDASGASVVVLARSGQDLSQYRLRWSHLGLAYRGDDGRWRIVHKLNQCGSPRADLYRQGLGEFFLDDMFQYRAALAVLTPDVQARLLPLLQDNGRVQQLHTQAYSMVAYPWATTYQQSNQWAIETLAMAAEPGANTRERAQAWLRFKGYEPTTLHISALTRLGARLTAGNIAFDDHPDDKRYSNRIETVTVDSVLDWLQRSGLATAVEVVRSDRQRSSTTPRAFREGPRGGLATAQGQLQTAADPVVRSDRQQASTTPRAFREGPRGGLATAQGQLQTAADPVVR